MDKSGPRNQELRAREKTGSLHENQQGISASLENHVKPEGQSPRKIHEVSAEKGRPQTAGRQRPHQERRPALTGTSLPTTRKVAAGVIRYYLIVVKQEIVCSPSHTLVGQQSRLVVLVAVLQCRKSCHHRSNLWMRKVLRSTLSVLA